MSNFFSSWYNDKVWELWYLSLFEKLPEGGQNCIAVSFLSFEVTTGKEVDVGMAHRGGLSLTVKSDGKVKRINKNHPEHIMVKCPGQPCFADSLCGRDAVLFFTVVTAYLS